jgi:hypothetical protein
MLDPETLWRIKTDANVVPVPPPVRKINSKGTAVLNAQRAGQWRRQIQEEAQDYSGFGLKAKRREPVDRRRPRRGRSGICGQPCGRHRAQFRRGGEQMMCAPRELGTEVGGRSCRISIN